VKSLEITFYKTFFLALLATIFTIEVSVAQWQTKVDSLVQDAIAQKAFPGAQVLVAHKGEIVLERAYGFHTYDSLLIGLLGKSTGIKKTWPLEKYLPTRRDSPPI